MYHVFYFNGDANKISWCIQTDNSKVRQNRTHVEIYKNKVTNIQSKYVALHVGLFWGIGVFIIKNKDSVKIMFDEKEMYDHFTTDRKIEDEFMLEKMRFIKQLIKQRELKIKFQEIKPDENLSIKNTSY
ncbi:MAG: hypothetical protein OEL84_03555 [Nitrosopumilus sp.]|nr:hypothetical protein [Nitrosopumilus sp.]MDH3340346.1 hypothetical protein [Nitrosopumilus sp.]